MSEFIRETRYGVTKIKRLLPKQRDAFFQEFSELCTKHGTTSVSCVVVEKGWPIYEEVWGMVQRLAEGRPQKIEQLQQENKALQAKNDALVARAARLEAVIDKVDMYHGHCHDIKCSRESNSECECGHVDAQVALNETESESLAEIKSNTLSELKAWAIENSKTDWATTDSTEFIRIRDIDAYANQLRQQSK